ncbi:MAG: hypothetical protein ACI85L_001009, partial [Pseudomonadota bacterium]
PTAYQLALVSAWYWIMVLFLAKQIITLYHAAQKSITKDQHALERTLWAVCIWPLCSVKVHLWGATTLHVLCLAYKPNTRLQN